MIEATGLARPPRAPEDHRVPRLALLMVVIATSRMAFAQPPPAPAPEASQRVVLADPDPELRHAMQTALAPWKLQVLTEDDPPPDTVTAEQRAQASTARFVVWRDSSQLVVYDHDRGSAERRDSRSGTLDPPTAAAAALTIKTMMRLPPLETPKIVAPPPPVTGPDDEGFEIRVQASSGIRFSPGVSGSVGRFGGVAMIRPFLPTNWRFGIAADAGTGVAVDAAGFKGTWTDTVGIALASWTWTHDAFEVEPYAGAGITYSVLDGHEMANAPRNESTVLATVRGGAWGRWRFAAMWTIGAHVGIEGVLGTPTYTKPGSPAEVFKIPGVSLDVGVVVAADL